VAKAFEDVISTGAKVVARMAKDNEAVRGGRR
jgi:hypothetical protein